MMLLDRKRMRIAVGQSGGPTAAINATLCGVLEEAKQNGIEVIGMLNGIEGFLQKRYMNCSELSYEQLMRLKKTPAAFLGSCRYRLPEDLSASAYKEVFLLCRALHISAILYIGGNDSMDTVMKLAKYQKLYGGEVAVIGLPKTIDNDLLGTDHTPGYGSAARYVATAIQEISMDAAVYEEPSVTIVEIMGRNAGWLTAASALARNQVQPFPSRIYLPEDPFDKERFLTHIETDLRAYRRSLVCVSEGIKDENGKLICEGEAVTAYDAFGNRMMSGCARVLEGLVKQRWNGIKCRSMELGILQRCAAHCISETDIREAEAVGREGVRLAAEKKTGVMVGIQRKTTEAGTYAICLEDKRIEQVYGAERVMPKEWILSEKADVSDAFLDYARPLVFGGNASGETDYICRRELAGCSL